MDGSYFLNINLRDLEDQASGFIDLYICMIEGFHYLPAEFFFEIQLTLHFKHLIFKTHML